MKLGEFRGARSSTDDVERGYFVALEGIDGVGKTTQARQLAELLRESGRIVTECADGAWGPYGAAARAWLHWRGASELYPSEVVSDDSHFALEGFVRDRQALSGHIRRELDLGHDVVCDRWEPSTWAYQLAMGLPSSDIVRMILRFPTACRPNLTIWLRLDPERALERLDRAALAHLRESMRARYDTPSFLRDVHTQYERMRGDLWTVDASLSFSRVTAQICDALPLVLRRPAP